MGLRSRSSSRSSEKEELKATDVPQSDPSKGAMIDVKSMAEYRREFEQHRLHNRHVSDAEILHRVKEYIKRRIDGLVDEESRKRVMDVATVALSVTSSTIVPFSGVAVVVAATVMQCLNFSVTLGLIPLLNVRSLSDLKNTSSQMRATIERASKSGLMAGVEASVLEILKEVGVGDWLWAEILKDVLVEMIGDSAMDAAWIMTPLLALPKYKLHRHLIKKMFRKQGDKAHVVHQNWTERNCIQVVEQVQVDALGNVQGVSVQSQEVSTTNTAAVQVSQTDAYFQRHDGGAAEAQVLQTNLSFEQQNGGTGQGQMSQTHAFFAQHNGGAAEVQASQINAYFPPQSEGAGQAQVSHALEQQAPPPQHPQLQQQQWPAYPPNTQSPFTNPAPGMIPGYSQVPIQATPYSNPPEKKTGTLIMGYTPPKNSSFFQPQTHAGVYRQAAAAAQTYTPPPNPTFFQQPYGTQQTQMQTAYAQPRGYPYVQMGDFNKPASAPSSSQQTQMQTQTQTAYAQPRGNPYVQMRDFNKPASAPSSSQQTQMQTAYAQPRGNPYVQMGDFNKPASAPSSSTPGHLQSSPYVQMGDFNKSASAPSSSTPGHPQFSPYGQVGDHSHMQVPAAFPQGVPGYQASAPPADLWYQQQAN